MSWARLDDKRHGNGKLLAAGRGDPLRGLAANGLDANGITHCAQHETDGFVEETALPLLAPGVPDRIRADLVTRLLMVGRWEHDKDRGGYWIHNYLDYNPSHAKLEADREEGRIRAERSRERKANVPPKRQRTFEVGSHDPSRPVPSPTGNSSSSNTGIAPAAPDDDSEEPIWKIWAERDRQRLIDETGQHPRDDSSWLAKVATNRRSTHQSAVDAILGSEPCLTDDEVIDRLEKVEERHKPHPLDATAAAARANATKDRTCPDCGGSGWLDDGADEVLPCPCLMTA